MVKVYVSVAVAARSADDDAPFTEGAAEKAAVLPQMARMMAEAVANFMVGEVIAAKKDWDRIMMWVTMKENG